MEQDAATKPLKYGVLTTKHTDGNGRQYVDFSQYEVELLFNGMEYL